MTPTRLNAIIQKNILECGVHLIGVFDHSPPFTYTVGLSAKFGFEFIMLGLQCEYAGLIMNEIAALDMPPELDVPLTEFSNLPLMLKICNTSTGPLHDEYVCQADRFYGKEVKVVQIVMCDKSGHFPGHSEFDHEYMDPRQKLFYDF